MPNGKLWKINPKTGKPNPPKHLSNYKKAINLEEGLVVARLRAELRYKKSQKGMEKSVREHIGKAIDRLDPMESVAIVGMTVIVKGLIDTAPQLQTVLSPFSTAFAEAVKYVQPALSGIVTAFEFAQKGEVMLLANLPDYLKWILAFTIAYIIVRHGGQLLGLMKEGTGTLISVVGALMGVAA